MKDTQINESTVTLHGKEDKETSAETHSNESDFHAQKDEELSLDTRDELNTSCKDDALEADTHKHESDSAVDKNAREIPSEQGTTNRHSLGVEEKVRQESNRLDAANRRTGSDIWDELEDVVCEVIEEEESRQAEKQKEKERFSDQLWDPSAIRAEEPNKHMAVVFEDALIECDGGETEGEVQLETREDPKTTEGNVSDQQGEQLFEEISSEPKESDDGISAQARLHHCEGLLVKEEDKEEQKCANSGSQAPRSNVTKLKEAASVEYTEGGVGSKLVAFKNPKIQQVKAVPVVPPKPQHCRITALALRQQQKERGEPDRGGDVSTRDPVDQGAMCSNLGKDWRCSGTKEGPTLRPEEADREQKAARDSSRNSPLSMCFDEAVAKATMRREREKEHEKERQREWSTEVP